MTEKQKELMEDMVVRSSPITQKRIAEVMDECSTIYKTKIADLYIELEQEKVISNGLESVIKDAEEVLKKIQNKTEDNEIKEMIDGFFKFHEG